MRIKILVLGLIFIFLFGFISAQLSESDVVYVVPDEKVFHIEGCEKLGSNKTGMSVRHAREVKEYEPCSECILSKGITFYEKSSLIAQEKPKVKKNLKATTEDGRKVLLKTDGTWEFIKEEAKVDKPASITVYITKTGGKYHRSSCSYLRRSKIPISLKDACGSGYTPCSRCKPPRCK